MSNGQSPQPKRHLFGHLIGRYAWIPIPLLVVAIAGLWVADLRTDYESHFLLLLLNLTFRSLVALYISYLAARSFHVSGQPGLLMLGCGSLMWGLTSTASAVLIDSSGNLGNTVYSFGALWAALCHLGGLLLRKGRLHRTIRWLTVSYAVVVVAIGLLAWAAKAGWTPIFFVQGQGGTYIRQIMLLSALIMFAVAAWLMLTIDRQHSSTFFYWYGLGLASLAVGLTGVMLQSVHGSLLGWTGRITQYLGGVYLFIAVMVATREMGTSKISLVAVEQFRRENGYLAGFRQQSPLRWVLSYGLVVVIIAISLGLRQALTAWFGTGLPTYSTFYPSIMLVALLFGLGPGVVATVLASFAVDYWILQSGKLFDITAPIDRSGLVIFIGMGLSMSILAELYRHNREKAAAYDREVALHDTKVRLAMFAEATFEGIVETKAGRIVDCNEQLARLLGYPVAELRGRDIADFIAPEDRDRVMTNIRQDRESVVEHAMLRKDGTQVFVEAHDRDDKGLGSGMHYTAIRDITERKRGEKQLRNLNRILRTRIHSSEALLHATEELAYLQDVCNIAVEDCGHDMVWIGYTEDDADKTVRPLASAGFDAGYLETLRITWADTERGHGPTGTAIRTGKMSICRNVLTDPLFAPWREEALKRGYASAIAFPLIAEGRCLGAITIYSRHLDSLMEDEVLLLTELADNLVYGILAIRLRVERASASEALRVSEKQFKTLTEVSPSGIWQSDEHGKYTYVSARWSEITGISSPEAFARSWSHGIHPDDQEPVVNEWFQEAQAEAVYQTEFRFVKPDGKIIWVLCLSRCMDDSLDAKKRWVGTITDITERRNAEIALQNQADFTRRVLDSTDSHIAILNEQGTILDVNTAWCRFAIENNGYDISKLGVGANYFYSWSHIFGDITYAEEAFEAIRQVQGGEKESFQIAYPCHSPTEIRWFSMRVFPMQGSVGHVLVSHTEISALKRTEEHLSTALAEKEVLLREVHHRVKNNLAAIVSLLNMQSRIFDDPQCRNALSDLSGRIHSMSLVHEMLYRADSLTQINFQNYIQNLVTHLRTSLSASHITFHVDAQGVAIPLDFAVPCGMIINELIINALKHAFPAGKPSPGNTACLIRVTMSRDNVSYSFSVADNGVGLPPGFDWTQCRTLGMVLIRMLGQHQLGGNYALDQKKGTCWKLTFTPRKREKNGNTPHC